tara:strand:- start:37 stop:261 length:225 start_codon:yes stop_codon:yes gene_type:complete
MILYSYVFIVLDSHMSDRQKFEYGPLSIVGVLFMCIGMVLNIAIETNNLYINIAPWALLVFGCYLVFKYRKKIP